MAHYNIVLLTYLILTSDVKHDVVGLVIVLRADLALIDTLVQRSYVLYY